MKPWVSRNTSKLRCPELPKTAFRAVASGKSGVNSDLGIHNSKKAKAELN